MTIKLLFLAFILFVSLGEIQSQTHLKLILKTSVPIDSAYVGHFTDKEFVRLPFKETLEFDFKIGKTDFYHINYLQNEKIFNQRVYLDGGNTTIFMRIENDKLLIDKVIGSPIFDAVEKWKKQRTAVAAKNDPAALDSFLLKTYEEQIDNIFSFSIGSRYLELHQNDKLKLYALLPLIARQGDELKKRFGFSLFNDRLEGIIKNNSVTISDFELIDPANKTEHAYVNSDFIILDFWFVGCLPCVEDHKRIKKMLPLLRQKNAELISISNDDSYPTWKDYIEKHSYSWRQFKKPEGEENIISLLGISTYPTYILLDKTGKILFSTYSLDQILKRLDTK